MLDIVLPAYNEEQSVTKVIEDIERVCACIEHRIIVVDDGSTDHTGKVLQELKQQFHRLEILTHSENRGLGEALLTGFRYVTQNVSRQRGEGGSGEQDIIITMDADNTHPADRIPLLCRAINEGAEVVIASRFVAEGQQHGLGAGRRVLSWGAGRVMRLFFPMPGLHDYSSGYRAYRRLIMTAALQFYGERLIESRSFAAMAELLLKLLPLCRRITEVPLQLHYERKLSASKMKVGTTILGYIRLIYRSKKESWRMMKWAEQ